MGERGLSPIYASVNLGILINTRLLDAVML